MYVQYENRWNENNNTDSLFGKLGMEYDRKYLFETIDRKSNEYQPFYFAYMKLLNLWEFSLAYDEETCHYYERNNLILFIEQSMITHYLKN